MKGTSIMNYDVTLSMRATAQLLGLFQKAREYQPSANRIESFNQALDKALLSTAIDWKCLSRANITYASNGSTPEFIQLKVNSQQWNDIVTKIKESFNPPLKRTTTPYIVKLVMLNYINYLLDVQCNENTDENKTKSCEKDSISFEEFAALDIENKLNTIYKLLIERNV